MDSSLRSLCDDYSYITRSTLTENFRLHLKFTIYLQLFAYKGNILLKSAIDREIVGETSRNFEFGILTKLWIMIHDTSSYR